MGTLVVGPWPPVQAPTLNKLALANHWGCSAKTIERYMAAGLPHERNRKGHAIFRLDHCEAWRERRRAS